MRLHILGICGTFMGGVAVLARELGLDVEGSDARVYPPMSTQLQTLGIDLSEGYSAETLQPAADLVVVGNAMSRGNAAVEHMLNQGLSYTSGPRWLGDTVLPGRQVLAVAGTHGKTTTASLLAHLLDVAGHSPGFLIGGVPGNFGVSARLGQKGGQSAFSEAVVQGDRGREKRHSDPLFVLEADEYDTAFFDKRSKFVHYHPRIAVLNNLEYDHADIFDDVAAIQRQFHHLVRTVPGNGRLIVNAEDARLAEVLAMGCWTPVETFGIEQGDWRARVLAADGSAFVVSHDGNELGEVRWSLAGRHNVMNALAALAAANAAGIDPVAALPAFGSFINVKRRMESLGVIAGVHVYDDFAHHPTAIATTLAGLRARVDTARILVALEPRSNSMRGGVHAATLAPSLAQADAVIMLHPKGGQSHFSEQLVQADRKRRKSDSDPLFSTAPSVDALLDALLAQARPGDYVVFMSNGGFEDAPRRFLDLVRQREGVH